MIRKIGKILLGRSSMLDNVLLTGREFYSVINVGYTKFINKIYGVDIVDPYRLYWVNPDNIEYMSPFESNLATVPKYKRAGKMRGGKWDQKYKKFENTTIYESFESHFIRNVSWENTEFYHNTLRKIDNGQKMWGCSSEEELKKRCQNIDNLYEDIKNNGYKTQKELKTKESVMDSRCYLERYCILENEIAVDIGHDGTLLFADGRNRLSIVKLLGIDRIPVIVLIRHKNLKNDKYARRTLSS